MKKSLLFSCIALLAVQLVMAQSPDKKYLQKERDKIRREISQLEGSYDVVKVQQKQTMGQLSLIEKQLKVQDKYAGSVTWDKRSPVTRSNKLAILKVRRKQKYRVIASLALKEKKLKKDLAVKRKKDSQLQKTIAMIVRRNIHDAKKKFAGQDNISDELLSKKSMGLQQTKLIANNPPAPDPVAIVYNNEKEKYTEYLDLSAKDIEANKNFEVSKGRMIWPVDSGFVKIPFGEYVVKEINIKGDNPGISITTPSPGTGVKVVLDGEVADVYKLGDESMAVTVRHGKYFTTYSNLGSVTVTKNQVVHRGQVIGTAGLDDESDSGLVDFILMNKTTNVDPLIWLQK